MHVCSAVVVIAMQSCCACLHIDIKEDKLMPPARRPLLDITNYNPTAFKTVAASAWRATIPVPVNKRRQLECIKAEEFAGREGDVARYLVEEACAGRIWNSYRSETVMANKNKARNESKQAAAGRFDCFTVNVDTCCHTDWTLHDVIQLFPVLCGRLAARRKRMNGRQSTAATMLASPTIYQTTNASVLNTFRIAVNVLQNYGSANTSAKPKCSLSTSVII